MLSKKILLAMLLFVGVTAIMPNRTYALSPVAMAKDTTGQAQLMSEIVSRVNEIDQMDKTNLSPAEKKSLRNELKGLKHKAEGLDRRVYLSVGAIIVIILLLILILR